VTVHLINPSHVSFGIGVLTPRWLYVLASATPAEYGTPRLVDETLEQYDSSEIETGDVVGIGIHTGNALRGYQIGIAARAAGAYVVFGGIHATLYPDEAHEIRGAHSVVTGDVKECGRSCCRTAPPTVRASTSRHSGRAGWPSPARRLFAGQPMLDLEVPIRAPQSTTVGIPAVFHRESASSRCGWGIVSCWRLQRCDVLIGF
jgi:hypothetical protein